MRQRALKEVARVTKHSGSMQGVLEARTFDEGALGAAVGGGVGGVGHAPLPAGIPPAAPLHRQLAVRPARQRLPVILPSSAGFTKQSCRASKAMQLQCSHTLCNTHYFPRPLCSSPLSLCCIVLLVGRLAERKHISWHKR